MEVNVIKGPSSLASRVSFGVGKLSHIQRMQTIHILVLGDAFQNSLLVDVTRKGQLHQYTINSGILIHITVRDVVNNIYYNSPAFNSSILANNSASVTSAG